MMCYLGEKGEFYRECTQRSAHGGGDVHIDPKIVVTKRNLSGPNATGGAIGIDRFHREVRRLLPSFDYVTTLYDFYGFKGRLPDETPEALCLRMSAVLERPRHLIPYVQVHEFEALLFSAPPVLAGYLGSQPFGQAVAAAVSACGGAEQVNDLPQSAPSKRLLSFFREHLNQRYDKPFHGPLLAMEIGLPAIRSACPRFDAWMTQLEQLTN